MISREVPMIASKFGIGQQVRHTLLGYLGVSSSMSIPSIHSRNRKQDEIAANDELRAGAVVPCGDGR